MINLDVIVDYKKVGNDFQPIKKSVIFESKELEELAYKIKNFLNDGGRASMISLIANTSVGFKPKYKGSPYGAKDNVKSIKKYIAMTNFNYTNSVNNRKEKEGQEKDFKASSNWHVKLWDTFNGTIAVKKKDAEKGVITSIYITIATTDAEPLSYTIQGAEATNEQIETIKKWKKDRAEEASKSQGLEKKNAVIFSTIAVANIMTIKANKKVMTF
jgi:hypothetical protein